MKINRDTWEDVKDVSFMVLLATVISIIGVTLFVTVVNHLR